MSGLITALRARAGGHDRPLAIAAALLVAAGLVLSLAASPAIADRMRYGNDFYFAWRHAGFAAAAFAACLVCANLPPVAARRFGVVLLAVAFAFLCVVPFLGAEVKGAQRWLRLGALSVQPSEFLKPGLVVTAAWMLSERLRRPEFPGLRIVAALYLACGALLVLQPDIGQTLLIGATLALMIFMAGVSWTWIIFSLAVGALAFGAAYAGFEHVQARVHAFLHPDGPGYQVARALEAIQSGGLLGRGPGEGVVKDTLPDAHADFVYAVAAEEFGVLASVGLLALYATVVWRGLSRAQRVIDPFAQIAAAGLFGLLALQALVHVAVNVSLAPAKGMTLPLVSYGGSSMIGSGVTLGLALALIRERPGALLFENDASLATGLEAPPRARSGT